MRSTPLTVGLLALLAAAPSPADVERLDLYDPTTGAYLGHESTTYGYDGRRLRLEIRDAGGEPSLLFFVLHDEEGRETEARYFEGGSEEADREVFSDWDDMRIVTYASGERTEIELDEAGRERAKRFYRADGTHYGEEAVLWDSGRAAGWDFRYVGREGGASFRYRYPEADDGTDWRWRTRDRDGEPERLEVRSRLAAAGERLEPAPFLPGLVSTVQSETSPSFTADGTRLVFARYGDDWERKRGFIAEREGDGWRIEALDAFGELYNLAISPDGEAIYFSVRGPESVELFRSRRTAEGWSEPENLTESFGVRGGYVNVTQAGDLDLYDADDAAGGGIYRATAEGAGFSDPVPVFTPGEGEPFDGFRLNDDEPLLVTRCFDDLCEPGARNGIWAIGPEDEQRKLDGVGYGWGAQPVPALGIFIYTDGEDILALPLSEALR